jgi:Pyruvate/2-oxoacid:ferredoxin oxidoreductase delta subunit
VKRNKKTKSKDAFLEERLVRVDRWLKKGRIPISSKVIPVNESLSTKQWVLPTEQAIEILRNARSFALTKCECRIHYKRCENPVDVCLLINDAADKYVMEEKARYISLNEVKSILRQANERGLVHLTIYDPEQSVYAVCSCCSCCCHDLQFLRVFGRRDLIGHSEYITQTKMELCSHCGTCIKRCVFGVRLWKDNKMTSATDECFGCGLCVTFCPTNAISMELRKVRKKEQNR